MWPKAILFEKLQRCTNPAVGWVNKLPLFLMQLILERYIVKLVQFSQDKLSICSSECEIEVSGLILTKPRDPWWDLVHDVL